MKLVKLQGKRVCSVCYDRNRDKPEWREDIIGLVIGTREFGVPPGLCVSFCPKHLDQLQTMTISKITKPKRKRKLKRRKHG
jgi:hypothetical protein